jgi:hypothetical protein
MGILLSNLKNILTELPRRLFFYDYFQKLLILIKQGEVDMLINEVGIHSKVKFIVNF